MSGKTSLHVLCLYRSPNSSSENNKLLNQLIPNTSLIDGKLLILGNFNFPTINWDNLSTPHLSNHSTSEFLAAAQDAFLFQCVHSPIHTRPNQKPTLTDLIFSQDGQTITNMTTSAPLGISHHKGLRFDYIVGHNSKNETPRYLYHRANYASMKLELQKVDWCKCFIILALLNVGENLNKSLISNFKICLLTKADSEKTPNLYG